MSDEDELKPVEKEAIELLREKGEVYQSQLWKELDISSRKASRVLSDLEEKDMILRDEATYDGHRTYLIRPTRRDRDYSLLLAGDMLSPFVGVEDVDPIESDAFTQWIMILAEEKKEELAEA